MHSYYVYIMASSSGTLYVGVTNNLARRVIEHKTKINKCFTSRYTVDRLVYYESFQWIHDAIAREKQLKGKTRAKKMALIRGFNPKWKDLGREFIIDPIV